MAVSGTVTSYNPHKAREETLGMSNCGWEMQLQQVRFVEVLQIQDSEIFFFARFFFVVAAKIQDCFKILVP